MTKNNERPDTLFGLTRDLVKYGKFDDGKLQRHNAPALEEYRRANITPVGQIQLSLLGKRAHMGTTQDGIARPDHANRPVTILDELGVRYYGSLKSNLKYPSFKKGNTAEWSKDGVEVGTNDTTLNSVVLTPKRLATVVLLSDELMHMAGETLEQDIKDDMMRAAFDRLQATIFSDCPETETTPKGLLHGVTPLTVTDYDSLIKLELQAAQKNIENGVFVVSPIAAAKLRQIDAKGERVFKDGMIDGFKTYVCNSVQGNSIIFGDFSDLVVCDYGGVDILVDHITHRKEGKIKFVLNTYFSFAAINDSFVFATV